MAWGGDRLARFFANGLRLTDFLRLDRTFAGGKPLISELISR